MTRTDAQRAALRHAEVAPELIRQLEEIQDGAWALRIARPDGKTLTVIH